MDGKGNWECFKLFLTTSKFYIQTAFDFFGRQPSIPHIFSFVHIHLASFPWTNVFLLFISTNLSSVDGTWAVYLPEAIYMVFMCDLTEL